MNKTSKNIYNIALQILKTHAVNESVINFLNMLSNYKWEITINSNKIVVKKKTLFNFLEIEFLPKIHIFFYHKNTSTDPYMITNAYIFGECLSLHNLSKLEECLKLVEAE